jgi:6-phosphogluconolactonase (cycloisomerase 2 family)
MTIGKWTRLLFVVLPLLAGCKGFWDAPAGTGTGGGGTGADGGVFYVLNQQTAQIAAYTIVKGTLTAVTGSPYTLASGPLSIAIAPNNAFLYVSTSSGIYNFTIGTGGALTLQNATPISSDFAADAMTVDATNSWLLDASGAGFLYAIPISSSNGTLDTAGTVEQIALPSITAPQKIAISPDNKNIFVALGSGGTAVVPFTAATTTAAPNPFGTVAAIAVKGTSGAAVSVAVDPSSRLFYIGEVAVTSGSTNTGGIRAFEYASLGATVIEVSGSPYPSGGLAPYSILPTPHGTGAGAYVFVANRTVSGSTKGNITGFALTTTGTTYTLTALSSTVSAGTFPVSLAQDSSGTYILVVNAGSGTSAGGSPDLEAYTMSAGKLTSALTSATGTDPVAAMAIAAAP